MKRKKQPVMETQEPKTFNYPRLYARFPNRYDRQEHNKNHNTRLRIIYPDGKRAQYSCYFTSPSKSWQTPCWIYLHGKTTNPWEQLEQLKLYDRGCGYRTVFLGEIK